MLILAACIRSPYRRKMIRFNFLELSANILNQASTNRWLNDVIIAESKLVGEIDFIFCTDEYLHGINISFLSHDTYTDIITFPTSHRANIISGEIYISIDRVKENAEIRGLEIMQELARVMVHGILHLTGYSDKTDDEKSIMRAKEDYYLNLHP